MSKNENSLSHLLLFSLLGLVASANERQLCAATNQISCDSPHLLTTPWEEEEANGLELVQLKGQRKRKQPSQDADSEKLLFMTAIGNDPSTMDLIMADIDHLRNEYSGTVDVFFMHYDGSNKVWMDRNSSWYLENVQRTSHIPGLKLPLVSRVITDFEEIKDYSWIWVMDDDVDITQTDISKLFKLADETGSPIVGPAILSPPGEGTQHAPLGRDDILFSNESVFQDRSNMSSESDKRVFHHCKPGDPICRYQQADLRCRFSYTRLIEVLTPLFRPEALWHTIHECPGCFSDNSVWGLDLIWCSRSAKLYDLPADRGCALIDQSPVLHTNRETLPKYDPTIAQDVMEKNTRQFDAVREAYPDDIMYASFSWKPVCVH